MSDESILEAPGAPPESEFQRTIVFRKDERPGAQLVLECGHAVFQVVALPHMGIGQKMYLVGAPVIQLNEAYALGFIAGAKEALQAHA